MFSILIWILLLIGLHLDGSAVTQDYRAVILSRAGPSRHTHAHTHVLIELWCIINRKAKHWDWKSNRQKTFSPSVSLSLFFSSLGRSCTSAALCAVSFLRGRAESRSLKIDSVSTARKSLLHPKYPQAKKKGSFMAFPCSWSSQITRSEYIDFFCLLKCK